jgi:microcystin degradation protein MlrC
LERPESRKGVRTVSFRVALGGIAHETNTYCTGTTDLAAFRPILRGEHIIATHRGVRSYLGGMIAAAEELGAVLVPTLWAWAEPSGVIAADVYASLLDELLAGISAALPLDAVALALHGAGVAEGVDDLEGHLCRAVRSVVGPAVKIVVSLDLHGNITQTMADAVEGLFGVHEYPHTDMYERGHEAVMLIPRLLAGGVRPVSHVESVPLLLPPSPSGLYPAQAVNRLCAELEERHRLIDCTFFHGFPYADVPLVGVHIVATADGDRALARSCAREVARWVWAHREEFRPTVWSPAEAIRQALALEGGPIVINETSDNPGGGAPGDGTHLLRAMLVARLRGVCFGFIYDPEVAEVAHRVGVGATIAVELGGKADALHGGPLPLTAYVKCLSDGRFVRTAMGRGAPVDLGKTARLQVDGVDILVSSFREQVFDPEVFLLHGIDVIRYTIVALKSAQHFRAGFAALARAIITADSPGLTTVQIGGFPRRRGPGLLWPLDVGAQYETLPEA